jgi:tRNA A-37 threonylcarbamoyl transferase component Bud32
MIVLRTSLMETCMQHFTSKRNTVTLRGGLVYKQTQSPLAAAEEAAILCALHERGAAVPRVLECRDAVLALEYLPGAPLPDLIERGAYEPQALASALCDWFAGFYAAVPEGESRGDVNGRNFLVHEGSIYSVDFEGRVRGSKARDAGRLAAFLGTYRTCDAAKQAALAGAFMREFAGRFGCGAEEIMAEREVELVAMRGRRSRGES